ncbi:MAG: hypothetical protein J5612_03795, partial [Paludibacteraceae bacterium]|nr:hypothetical protein [Paludibacteraceae bacterium]
WEDLAGVELTIFAVAEDGYIFDHWSDDNTDAVRIVTIPGNDEIITYTAYFVPGTPTELDAYNATESQTLKFIREGQLLIFRNGEIYNAQGTKIK